MKFGSFHTLLLIGLPYKIKSLVGSMFDLLVMNVHFQDLKNIHFSIDLS
jgi:hypothetical protein